MCMSMDKGATIQSPGNGWTIFEMNNFEQTLHEIKSSLLKL